MASFHAAASTHPSTQSTGCGPPLVSVSCVALAVPRSTQPHSTGRSGVRLMVEAPATD